ncbi:msl0431 [Mesorhizobium japonicum MAFF 303099]|uniref:Msl0431 protein n=2 Tax=Mesorhizobium japonicum TaxID=2066070 RepID=Q98MU8_RHILO|nr:msl0431 [Mesorhizobium japonicum MAFF 303099]
MSFELIATMSTRGINFLDQWIANNIPETTKADVISVDELTHKLIADAKSLGIKRGEIDEEVDSLYRTILDAIVHYDPGLPE